MDFNKIFLDRVPPTTRTFCPGIFEKNFTNKFAKRHCTIKYVPSVVATKKFQHRSLLLPLAVANAHYCGCPLLLLIVVAADCCLLPVVVANRCCLLPATTTFRHCCYHYCFQRFRRHHQRLSSSISVATKAHTVAYAGTA